MTQDMVYLGKQRVLERHMYSAVVAGECSIIVS